MISPEVRHELERDDFRMKKLWARAYNERFNTSEAEGKLKSLLSNDYIFKVPLLDYIVDFFNPHVNLVVEVTRQFHEHPKTKNINRDYAFYSNLRVYTIRFWSQEVIETPEYCIQQIQEFLETPTVPQPLAPPTIEDLKRKSDRARELRDIRKQVELFEESMMGKSRAEVLKEFSNISNMLGNEVATRIKRAIDYWPTEGYAASGLQTVTLTKLRENK